MANIHARLARRGLLAQERWLTNPVAGAPQFRWPVKDNGEDVAAGAASFNCVPSMLQRGTVVEIGGKPVTIDLTLEVRRDLFHTADSLWSSAAADDGDPPDDWTAANPIPLPIANKLLKYNGVVYRILQVGDAGDHSHLEITLGDKHSGK